MNGDAPAATVQRIALPALWTALALLTWGYFTDNLVPALLGVRLRTYVIGTALGIIPGTFVYASVGNGLGALLDEGQSPDLSVIFNVEVIVPILGLALLSLLPVLYKFVKARRGGRP